MVLTGYRLGECLYQGERTEVYRAQRTDTGDRAIVKILCTPHPSFKQLVQFRNQYAIAHHLQHPGIVRPIALERYGNGYALVMPDEGAIPLLDYWQHSEQSIEQFLHIAIQLADALHYLHQQRIIHKDIKPANILISPETGQVKLIDFSISSLLPKEIQTLQNPNILEGSLAYLPPEQTGRMNRGIDYRSDFYSLGVTFYQLLAGQLPFESNDPIELVYCHIAQSPIPPENKREEKGTPYPSNLSEIVLKLMAKNAEDRYQSALGLKYDLEQCLAQWLESREISPFPLGERDRSDRFIIPEKLYGRETEVETLLQAFERVSLGATEMMLVAGFSGIGKTAVVNEVHKPIVRKRGYFIKGKYDQFNRNIPFSAFVQAFRDLMRHLLTESDVQIQHWKSQILEAVGENGQVISEVIPELEKIIGEQPAAVELSGTAAQNRFNLLFQKFTQVFTRAEHPLAIFLDDLQWADLASLKLIQVLMANTHHLLLIGAYRDNEVNPGHPLMLTLGEIQKTGFILNTISLKPLNQSHIARFVADALKSPIEVALPLSQLVFQKTQGNPFFTTQFLKALQEENFIQFNFDVGCWQCDIDRVKQEALTDDVVEFMTLQLEKLSLATQEVLKLAACIGNQFDLATLSIVSEESEIETSAALWQALKEGLILPQSEIYKFYVEAETLAFTPQESQMVCYTFLHDRVQQAAYNLIPNEEKQKTHLKIGQLLLQKTSIQDRNKKLFDIVNHLNLAPALITEASQRERLAELNLDAGKKAISATAYNAAIVYFMKGIDWLSDDCWNSQYTLCLSLYKGAAEAAFLTTNFNQMNSLAEVAIAHARSPLELVDLYTFKIQASNAQNDFLNALKMGKEILKKMGVDLLQKPTEADIERAFKHTQSILSNRSIESLLELPEMAAPKQKAVMSIMSNMMSAAYQVDPKLLSLLSFIQVELSVQYGNATESTYNYVQYGLMLIAILKDIDAGYRFGQLGINLLERLDASKLAAKTVFGFNVSLRHWREPARDTLNGFLQACASGVETGNFEFVALSILCYDYTAYFSGQELNLVKQAMEEHREILKQLRQESYLNIQSIYYQSLLNLLELRTEPSCLAGNDYDEERNIQLHLEGNQLLALCQIYSNKLLLSYIFARYEEALDYARLTEQYLDAAAGLMHVPLFSFYDALTQLAIYPTVSETEQTRIIDRVTVHQENFQQWEAYAPSNHSHRSALIRAERCRVLEAKPEASQWYDRAISEANKNSYIHEEALANELAAKFYLDWNKTRIAQEYMIEAYYCYWRWGAQAKVTDLEKRYPQLLLPILQPSHSGSSTHFTISGLGTVSATSSNTSSSTVSAALDLAAILKASQALSSEIELDKLLSSLLSIIIENAGADKCVLMLMREDRLLIKGSIVLGMAPVVLQRIPVEESQEIPRKLIYQVKHNLETEVLNDASTEPTLANDPYLQQYQPQSILCSPILHQGKLVGILYLENNLTKGAFTRERVELLNLLCAQAAISLENARLYERSQEYAQQLEGALQNLQNAQLQLIHSEKMSALGNLVAGVAHEMNNPLGFIAATLQQAQPIVDDVFDYLQRYQQTFPNASQDILDRAEEIDLDYVQEDLPKMLESMAMACDRLKHISKSLRTFSRADRDEKVPFNIHEGLDSTLLILKHRFKANEHRPGIEVVIHYSNLPEIHCFPGQLNQVFMNILANAIDALDESSLVLNSTEVKSRPHRITIQTSLEANQVKIRIADNGMGMTETVQQKIFDRLFTTKGVGKGTGLGLAISKSIVVEKHGGTLLCTSEFGKGTEFTISLPLG